MISQMNPEMYPIAFKRSRIGLSFDHHMAVPNETAQIFIRCTVMLFIIQLSVENYMACKKLMLESYIYITL